jgi:hypothetical protein
VAALEILHFLDGLAEGQRRRDMVLSSAVASGVITAVQAWPEYFNMPGSSGAFPSRDADMSEFELERATPESFEADMDALVRASQRITIREDELPPFPVLGSVLPDPEWP